MTRETQLVVDRAAALEAALLFGRQRRTAAARAAAAGAFRIRSATNCTPRALLPSIAALIVVDGFRNLQHIHRQHRLNDDVDVGVCGQRAVIGVERMSPAL